MQSNGKNVSISSIYYEFPFVDSLDVLQQTSGTAQCIKAKRTKVSGENHYKWHLHDCKDKTILGRFDDFINQKACHLCV